MRTALFNGRGYGVLAGVAFAIVVASACSSETATPPPYDNEPFSGGGGTSSVSSGGAQQGQGGGFSPTGGSTGTVNPGTGGLMMGIPSAGGSPAASGGNVSTGTGGLPVGSGGVPVASGGVPSNGGSTSNGGASGPGTPPVSSPGCSAGKGASGTFTMDISGTSRTYIVAAPPSDGKAKKLVFTWHYLGGTAQGIASGGYYGLKRLAGNDAVFVSPQGIDNAWPNTGGRDVAFATQMLEKMKSDYCVDTSRIFSVGFSYGAIMSNTVGCALGDQFRAITPMSGSGPYGACKGHVAAWLSHGDADTTVPTKGGEASRDHWVAANHCQTTTAPLGSCVEYQGCDPGYPVVWCPFSGGHQQPANSAQNIWTFLSRF